MPLLLDMELTSSSQKSGFVTAPSVSTAASTASNGNFVNDDFSLLARLEGIPIYAPPTPWPSRTGAKDSTKTQTMADCKSKRELKQKAAEENKCVAADCNVERESKKQEKLISSADVKASKATAKAEELRLKLAAVINTVGGLGWEFRFLVPISGTPIVSRIPIPCLIPKILVGIFF